MSRTAVISDEVLDLADSFGFRDRIHDVFDLTQEMFPGDVTVEVDADPEWPENEFIVFIVGSADPPKQVVATEARWHQGVAQLVPDCLNRLRVCTLPR